MCALTLLKCHKRSAVAQAQVCARTGNHDMHTVCTHTHTHTHVELQAHTVHYYTYMPYIDIDMPEVFNSSDVTLSPE